MVARSSYTGTLFCGLLLLSLPAGATGDTEAVDRILGKMRQAYGELTDYSMRVESETAVDGTSERQVLEYRFMKPHRIRIDFVSPHRGTALVVSQDGRVFVRPGGFLKFLTLPLDVDNPLLQVSPGQRIDQTDLGLLIEKIERSLTVERKGEIRLRETPASAVLEVRAAAHFLPDLEACYLYTIAKDTWLPAEIVERIPGKGLERTVRFLEMRLNPGLSEAVFTLDE